jgi:hypothetical protein
VRELTAKVGRSAAAGSAVTPSDSPVQYAASNDGAQSRQEPQFVGHTRADFSLGIAKSSLSRMGITTDGTGSASASGSRQLSPVEGEPPSSAPGPAAPIRRRLQQQLSNNNDNSDNTTTKNNNNAPHAMLRVPSGGCPAQGRDPLLGIPPGEVLRLIDVYQEQLHSIYPIINADVLVSKTGWLLDLLQQSLADPRAELLAGLDEDAQKDVRIVKVALASSIVVQAQGHNELSQRLVESVECAASHVVRRAAVDLRDVQLLTMISNYYFHCDDELLAWRTIGLAARAALETGMHREHTLFANFRDPGLRAQAIRTFWCVYVLDRRWSFGTGLPFALPDTDIDPELPEPADDFSYLRCLVGYGRLCSKVWEALPPVGSLSDKIPRDRVAFLEFLTHSWISSIPPDLQLRHPRLGLAPTNEVPTLRRLRTLLYLRGNHMRTMIRRHSVLSAAEIRADAQSAHTVVDIAKDSVQVLVNLAKTSDIYQRQQVAFNYFLLSAMAVLLLAVCHAPDVFSDSCRDSFSASVDLVRGFSRQSAASRRLWRSVRGLLPAARHLGLQREAAGARAAAGPQQGQGMKPGRAQPMGQAHGGRRRRKRRRRRRRGGINSSMHGSSRRRHQQVIDSRGSQGSELTILTASCPKWTRTSTTIAISISISIRIPTITTWTMAAWVQAVARRDLTTRA